jgi:serine protease Do
VVQKVSASVVQVYTSTRPRPMPGFNQEDPFNFFFGNPQTQPRRGQAPRQQGAGSGVIVSSDGYLLTNNHVIEGADDVKVKLSDGREVPAKVVGRDEKTDVAVLKITAEELSPATFADSDRLEVGDVVFAVGNPFGIGQTVTMGIISATSRATFGLPYEDFIQTDAAINPGNSGGALVDADGRLIGINTAIISRSGGNQGIGFAIPANIARDVLEALVTDGGPRPETGPEGPWRRHPLRGHAPQPCREGGSGKRRRRHRGQRQAHPRCQPPAPGSRPREARPVRQPAGPPRRRQQAHQGHRP